VRIYLAARYSKHPEMQVVRNVLETMGHDVTSRWIDCRSDVVGDFTSSFTPEFLNSRPDLCAPLARHDLDDINRADTVISFTYPPSEDGVKGGRHVEFGYALARGKRMMLVGPRQHAFHTLPTVEWYGDWPQLARSLSHTAPNRGERTTASRKHSPVSGECRRVPAHIHADRLPGLDVRHMDLPGLLGVARVSRTYRCSDVRFIRSFRLTTIRL